EDGIRDPLVTGVQTCALPISQKGSYVGPDKLTFDFSSAPLTPEQKHNVEKLVNEKIAENASVSWTEIPFAEAKQRKDIIQFFGEKYGDVVRVVQIGGEPKALNGYSMELCGGTHVRATGEIESFRIVKELAAIHAAKGNVVAEVKDADAKLLQAVGDALKSRIKGPIFLAGAVDGHVALLAIVPKEFSSKFQANKLIQEIAPIVGGKGGGRPENAQGAGTDVGKIDLALAEAERLITATQL